MDQLLSVSEAARRLGGISVSTVRAWLSQGRINRTKVGGRTMVRESELSRVIDGPSAQKEHRYKEPGPRSNNQLSRVEGVKNV
jgi:excisionase family DNA binding protein